MKRTKWPSKCDRCDDRVPAGRGFWIGRREIARYERYSGRKYYVYEDSIHCDKCVATELHKRDGR